jgi:hypothetical protein
MVPGSGDVRGGRSRRKHEHAANTVSTIGCRMTDYSSDPLWRVATLQASHRVPLA